METQQGCIKMSVARMSKRKDLKRHKKQLTPVVNNRAALPSWEKPSRRRVIVTRSQAQKLKREADCRKSRKWRIKEKKTNPLFLWLQRKKSARLVKPIGQLSLAAQIRRRGQKSASYYRCKHAREEKERLKASRASQGLRPKSKVKITGPKIRGTKIRRPRKHSPKKMDQALQTLCPKNIVQVLPSNHGVHTRVRKRVIRDFSSDEEYEYKSFNQYAPEENIPERSLDHQMYRFSQQYHTTEVHKEDRLIICITSSEEEYEPGTHLAKERRITKLHRNELPIEDTEIIVIGNSSDEEYGPEDPIKLAEEKHSTKLHVNMFPKEDPVVITIDNSSDEEPEDPTQLAEEKHSPKLHVNMFPKEDPVVITIDNSSDEEPEDPTQLAEEKHSPKLHVNMFPKEDPVVITTENSSDEEPENPTQLDEEKHSTESPPKEHVPQGGPQYEGIKVHHDTVLGTTVTLPLERLLEIIAQLKSSVRTEYGHLEEIQKNTGNLMAQQQKQLQEQSSDMDAFLNDIDKVLNCSST